MNIYQQIDQCLNDIQKYEQWGKLLGGQSLIHFFNSNSTMSYSVIHNGLKYAKAQMKLAVLYDDKHTDREKEERLKEIESDIHHLEELPVFVTFFRLLFNGLNSSRL